MSKAKSWAASMLAIGLAACSSSTDSFWDSAAFWQDDKASEMALAAVSRGDFVRAEAMGNEAMRRNPKDPFALLALAEVYQNTGRTDLARQYYQSLVSLNPQASAVPAVGPPLPIAELAARELAQIPGQAAVSDTPHPISRPVVVTKADLEPLALSPASSLASSPASQSCQAGSGVHLASFLSEARARQGWLSLKKKFPSLLGDLQPTISQTSVAGLGTVYRLNAGPLRGCEAAATLCRELKSRHQDCLPTGRRS